MTNRFLQAEEIRDFSGEEQLKFFCTDEDEEEEEDKEKDKGGRADA